MTTLDITAMDTPIPEGLGTGTWMSATWSPGAAWVVEDPTIEKPATPKSVNSTRVERRHDGCRIDAGSVFGVFRVCLCIGGSLFLLRTEVRWGNGDSPRRAKTSSRGIGIAAVGRGRTQPVIRDA